MLVTKKQDNFKVMSHDNYSMHEKFWLSITFLEYLSAHRACVENLNIEKIFNKLESSLCYVIFTYQMNFYYKVSNDFIRDDALVTLDTFSTPRKI